MASISMGKPTDHKVTPSGVFGNEASHRISLIEWHLGGEKLLFGSMYSNLPDDVKKLAEKESFSFFAQFKVRDAAAAQLRAQYAEMTAALGAASEKHQLLVAKPVSALPCDLVPFLPLYTCARHPVRSVPAA